MDRNQLVTMVTQLVLEELSKPNAGGGDLAGAETSNPVSPPSRKVLICGAPGSSCEKVAWDALRLLNDTHFMFVDWRGYPWERFPQEEWKDHSLEIVEPPEIWDDLVRSVEAVIVPFAPLDIMGKISRLIVDVPPVAMAVSALIQGVPVYIGGDDTTRWARHSARIPRAVISVVQEQVRTVQSMGALVDTPNQIVAELVGGVARLSSSKGAGGRDVVTNDDVIAVIEAGNKVLEVMHGSIITSLARETATRNGIEVRFR